MDRNEGVFRELKDSLKSMASNSKARDVLKHYKRQHIDLDQFSVIGKWLYTSRVKNIVSKYNDPVYRKYIEAPEDNVQTLVDSLSNLSRITIYRSAKRPRFYEMGQVIDPCFQTEPTQLTVFGDDSYDSPYEPKTIFCIYGLIYLINFETKFTDSDDLSLKLKVAKNCTIKDKMEIRGIKFYDVEIDDIYHFVPDNN